MPYCNQCGRYIGGGLLCEWCAEKHGGGDDPTARPGTGEWEPCGFPAPDSRTEDGEEPEAPGTTATGEACDGTACACAPTSDETPCTAASEGETDDAPEGETGDMPEETAHPCGARAGAQAEETGCGTAEAKESSAAGEKESLRNAETKESHRGGKAEREKTGKPWILFDTPDRTDRFSPREIREGRGMAVLCYLWILWMIPCFFGRGSRYVRFHLGQGLLLLLADCLGVTLGGTACLLATFAPVAAPLFAGVAEVVLLLSFAMKVWAIVGVARCRAKELPFLGGYCPAYRRDV